MLKGPPVETATAEVCSEAGAETDAAAPAPAPEPGTGSVADIPVADVTVRGRLRGFMPLVQGAALIEWTGTGLFLAVSTVYFVRVVGLGSASVGAGMSIAGVAAILAAPVVARLVNRYGPRRLLVAMNLLRAVATLGYLRVDRWWTFLAVAVVVAVTEQSGPPLIQAFVSARTREDRRTRVMAMQRTIVNLGISLGGLVAGLVLGTGGRSPFSWLLVGGSLGYVVVAAVFAGAKGNQGTGRGPVAFRLVWRDRRLARFALFNAVMALWTPILNLALPIWLATRTHAPIRLVGLLYAVNTVGCIVLQYPMNRFADSVGAAWRSYLAATGLLGLSCAVLAVAPSLHGSAVPAAFVAAVVLLTFAELLQVGASWTLSYEMSPPAQRSAYLVVFSMGRTVGSRVVGPLLLTGAVMALGPPGWIGLAALLALSGLYPLGAILRPRDAAKSAEGDPNPCGR